MLLAGFLTLFVIVWFNFGVSYSLLMFAMYSIYCAFVRYKFYPFIFIVVLLMLFRLESEVDHKLPAAMKHQTVKMKLCIDSYVKQYDEYSSSQAKIIDQPAGLSLRQVTLSIPSRFSENVFLPGDCLTGDFRLRQPFGRIVPGAFNADRYLFSKSIDAKVTLVDLTAVESLPNITQQLFLNISSRFNYQHSEQFWAALFLGWSGSFDADTKSILAENQLMHLFVVSGLHVALIGYFIKVLLDFIGKMLPRYMVLERNAKYLITLFVMAGYLVVLDWPVPATRALIMASIPMLASIFAYQLSWQKYFVSAVLLVSIYSPESWLGIGAWLSFIAVLIIIFIFRWGVLSGLSFWGKLFTFQLIMSVSIVPWSVAFGFKLNSLSIFVNILVTPIVSFLLLPMSSLIAVWPNDLLIGFYELVTHYLLAALVKSAEYSFLLPSVSIVNISVVVMLFWLAVWLPKSIEIKYTFLFGLLFILAVLGEQSINYASEVEITVFDVGHGQAILIDTPTSTTLYDTGGQIGDSTIYDRYLRRKLFRLDHLIISHSDLDHSAGANELASQFPRARLWAGQPDEEATFVDRQAFQNCHDSPVPDPYLQFISIPQNLRDSANDHSCVLLVRSNSGTLLITGDADKKIEYFLLQESFNLLPVNVVLLGHHGSKTSSAVDWLELHSESLMILSTGDRASPKWPNKDLQAWLDGNFIDYLSTASLGTLNFKLDDFGRNVKTWDSNYRKRLIR